MNQNCTNEHGRVGGRGVRVMNVTLRPQVLYPGSAVGQQSNLNSLNLGVLIYKMRVMIVYPPSAIGR